MDIENGWNFKDHLENVNATGIGRTQRPQKFSDVFFCRVEPSRIQQSQEA